MNILQCQQRSRRPSQHLLLTFDVALRISCADVPLRNYTLTHSGFIFVDPNAHQKTERTVLLVQLSSVQSSMCNWLSMKTKMVRRASTVNSTWWETQVSALWHPGETPPLCSEEPLQMHDISLLSLPAPWCPVAVAPNITTTPLYTTTTPLTPLQLP